MMNGFLLLKLSYGITPTHSICLLFNVQCVNFVNPFNFLQVYTTVYVVYLAVILIWQLANFCPSTKLNCAII